MKKLYLALLVLGGLIWIQPILHSAPGTTSGAATAYGAGNQSTDHLFKVTEASFDFHFKRDGTGEVLDIIFELNNQTIYPQKLKFVVLAFYESSKLDPVYRRFVPYYKWRKRDFEAEQKQIYFAASAPYNFKTDTVGVTADYQIMWKKSLDDDDKLCKMAKNKESFCKFDRAKKEKEIKTKNMLPPLWSFVTYIQDNQQKFSQEFTLPGRKIPDGVKAIVDLRSKTPKGNAVIYNNRLKSTIISSHESLYRPGYLLFNKAIIMLFDPKDGKLLYRRFYRFTRPLKMK